MGVKIYKVKKARHLLEDEQPNLWPAWVDLFSQPDLDRWEAAHKEWRRHRNQRYGGQVCGCKQSRSDGGIYVCGELNHHHVVLGYLGFLLRNVMSTVERVTIHRLIPGKAVIYLKEFPEEPVLVPVDAEVEIMNHLYDPDKDHILQPPRQF